MTKNSFILASPSVIKNPYPEAPFYPRDSSPVVTPPVVVPTPEVPTSNGDFSTGLLMSFDADSQADGALRNWVSNAGSMGAISLGQSIAEKQPVIVSSDLGSGFKGKKALKFDQTKMQFMKSANFPEGSITWPHTQAVLVKPVLPLVADSTHFVTGNTEGFMTTYMTATGRLAIAAGTDNEAVVQINDPSTADVLAGNWMVIVGVFNGEKSQVWLNGKLIFEKATAISNAAKAIMTGMTIGTNSSTSARAYNGFMSKINLYGRALSASDIQALTESWR